MIKLRDSLRLILAAQLAMFLTIGLDIPIARQIVGFVCISFIPGILILRILRLNLKSRVSTFLFSVGLSAAFLMFVGLLVNELYPLFGVLRPLSTIPLTITISGLTLSLFFVCYKQDLARTENANPAMKSRTVSSKALFLVFIPLLSVIGALYVNVPILLLMIIVIAALFALSVSSSRLVAAKLYPLVIFAISTALLFHTSLISKHLMGYDVLLEYYVFKLTEIKGYWQPPGIVTYASATATFKSVLSITILPTIYSLLLNIEGELIFKIIYPLVFSLIPVALYRIYERQTGKLVALISTLFFMSSPIVFYGVEPLSLARQMIGTLFLALSILLLVDKTIAPRKRQVLFLIFGAALVVSHYALSYLYLFYIIFTFILTYKRDAKKMLSGESVLLLIAMTFSWYMYVSDSPLRALTNAIQNIYYRFSIDLFNPQARSPWIFSLLSRPASGILGLVHRMLFYIQNLFIIIGIIELIAKPKKTKFDPEYRLMSILSMFILFLCVAVPNFAPTINLTRFYAITIQFLAPFFVLGGKTVLSWADKAGMIFSQKLGKVSYRTLELRLVSVVLIASFLFEVGFVNHVTGGYPNSYSLDLERKKTTNDLTVRIILYENYIPEQDVFSAIWLSKNVDEASKVYADRVSRNHVLTSYALIPRERVRLLSNSTILEHGAYVYLRHLNIVDSVIRTYGESFINTSGISSLLNESNKIYSNGDSEIYRAPGT